ncbi:hypothetical protein BS50DRAFT_673265 [Corynespora cassiicola Philippines]|uniref:F-box domain-containing protein n=1 Tax=Corynespora cassiicola Philippines TaxID=1448308 RepID=A0A2T2P4F9_CORCC|nr:hypothetical protein BS50DRAFT_673265 [Corynespora cassiicola Philippines]
MSYRSEINDNMKMGGFLVSSPSTSRLLALPGELRNRIYWYCDITHDIITQYVKNFYVSGQGKFSRDKLQVPARQRDSAFGLTRTCQLLRREFRPIYQRSSLLVLDILNVSAFLELCPNMDDTGAFGGLKILVPYDHIYQAVDVTALFKLSQRTKSFKIVFDGVSDHGKRTADALTQLMVYKSPLWKDWILNATKQIKLEARVAMEVRSRLDDDSEKIMVLLEPFLDFKLQVNVAVPHVEHELPTPQHIGPFVWMLGFRRRFGEELGLSIDGNDRWHGAVKNRSYTVRKGTQLEHVQNLPPEEK